MREEQTLYEYLYQSLLGQIESGVYQDGQALPSQQQLCRKYNVGITTVRKVMGLLARNGYLRTALGQAAVVTYQAPVETYRCALAGRREELADAYQGLGLILPPLYREGAKLCGEPGQRAMQKAIDGIRDGMDLPSLYRQANLFFAALIRPFSNLLALDLELDAENFMYFPYFPVSGESNPFELPAGRIQRWLQRASNEIARGDFDSFYEHVCRFYSEVTARAVGYLDALRACGNAAVPAEGKTRWFRVKSHSELYVRLSMMLLRRIAGGEFDNQTYLPSIPKIMEEYGVMKETASRAVALLNSMGIVQTMDKKGTVLAPENARISPVVDFADSTVQQRLVLCLDALQIMALTVRNCAAGFSSVTEEWADAMEKKLRAAPKNRTSPMFVQLLMDCAIKLAPCRSVRNIYRQLNELMAWGYYLQSADESLYPDLRVTAKAMGGVLSALKERAQDRLPLALEQAFLQIYRDVYSVALQLPFKPGSLPVLI